MSIKLSRSAALIATFMGVLFVIGCNSPRTKIDKAQYEVSEARKQLLDAQENYKKEVAIFKEETAQKIRDNEQNIADFSLKNKSAEEEEIYIMQNHLSRFEQKNEEIKLRMNNFEATEMKKWEAFKTELDHDITELGLSIKDFTISNEK
jgi:hypothetical protein